MSKPIRILYVGDSWMTAGTLGAFSSLTYDLRGASVENQAQRIIDHWRSDPQFSVDYMTGWDALARFPETRDAIGQYDVVFLSDVESDALILYPMDRSMRAPMGADALRPVPEMRLSLLQEGLPARQPGRFPFSARRLPHRGGS